MGYAHGSAWDCARSFGKWEPGSPHGPWRWRGVGLILALLAVLLALVALSGGCSPTINGPAFSLSTTVQPPAKCPAPVPTP